MAWFDDFDLDQETLGRLHSLYSDLEAEAAAYVRRPENARQFARYYGDVNETPEVSHMGEVRKEWEPVEYVWFPEGTPSSAGAWLAAGLLADAEKVDTTAKAGAPAGRPGRPEGSEVPIPESTLLWILERFVVGEVSAREIDRTTTREPGLKFVNKNKAGRIKKWVENHQTVSRHAVDRHEIPSDFRATDGGYLLPKR